LRTLRHGISAAAPGALLGAGATNWLDVIPHWELVAIDSVLGVVVVLWLLVSGKEALRRFQVPVSATTPLYVAFDRRREDVGHVPERRRLMRVA